MKKTAIVTLVILLIAGGVFYYFSGKEYVLNFSESQIQEKLTAKLPLVKTYLFIFQVTLDNPRVHLENGSNRLKAGLDIKLNIQPGKEQVPLGGIIDVSGGVKYIAEKGDFFLTDPVIERLAVEGLQSKYTDKINLVLTKALGEFYASHPIYSLKTTDIKQTAAKLILKNAIVDNKELVITLGI